MYPETQFEAEAAWDVLAPGGYLMGDDYDQHWPQVQQSVNEFVLRKGKRAFVDPAVFSAGWRFKSDMGRAELLDAPALKVDLGGVAPLIKGAQWILKKAHDADGTQNQDSRHEGARAVSRPPALNAMLHCCLNGWDDFVWEKRFEYVAGTTRCAPPRPYLQQEVCQESNNLPEAHCRLQHACRRG
jgi:hypothetical protein